MHTFSNYCEHTNYWVIWIISITEVFDAFISMIIVWLVWDPLVSLCWMLSFFLLMVFFELLLFQRWELSWLWQLLVSCSWEYHHSCPQSYSSVLLIWSREVWLWTVRMFWCWRWTHCCCCCSDLSSVIQFCCCWCCYWLNSWRHWSWICWGSPWSCWAVVVVVVCWFPPVLMLLMLSCCEHCEHSLLISDFVWLHWAWLTCWGTWWRSWCWGCCLRSGYSLVSSHWTLCCCSEAAQHSCLTMTILLPCPSSSSWWCPWTDPWSWWELFLVCQGADWWLVMPRFLVSSSWLMCRRVWSWRGWFCWRTCCLRVCQLVERGYLQVWVLIVVDILKSLWLNLFSLHNWSFLKHQFTVTSHHHLFISFLHLGLWQPLDLCWSLTLASWLIDHIGTINIT